MEFKLHTDFPTNLTGTWNNLLGLSILNVPFLSFEHMRIWWKTRGGGEWPINDQLAIVSGWSGAELSGLAPLFLHAENDKKTLMLLGSKEICDYLDLIVKPENLAEFVQGLLDFLTSESFPDWDEITFHNLMEFSPTINVLQEAAERKGWIFTIGCSKQSPFIKLPGSWEEYLLSLDKKQRHEIRRKLRRAEEIPDVQWSFLKDASDLEVALDDFLSLMAKDPQKSDFLTPLMKEHMRLVMRWAFAAGILQLSFLEIQNEKAASYFCFNHENKILVYNSGFNPQFSEYSPGWVLLADLIKWSIGNRIEEFDFMRGNEDYKYRFGATDRHIQCAIIKRNRT